MNRSSYVDGSQQHFYLKLRPEAPVKFRRTRNLWYWLNPQPYTSRNDALDARHRLAKELGISPLDVTYEVI